MSHNFLLLSHMFHAVPNIFMVQVCTIIVLYKIQQKSQPLKTVIS